MRLRSFPIFSRIILHCRSYHLSSHSFTRVMSSTAAASSTQKGNGGKTEVKILMLHGFTQSGKVFHAKTRALEKLLVKTLAPFNILPTLIYPTAPNRLRPSDFPGYVPPADGSDPPNEEDSDCWGWWRKDDATGTYRYFEKGMAVAADAIREAGGIDACCGFSQGAAMTCIVTAALEEDRSVPEGEEYDWARQLRDANGGKGLKFAVEYAGFRAAPDVFKFCFEPKITTPVLHIYGSLDSVVEEARTESLIGRTENSTSIVHPGGHHVPVSKEFAMPVAGFIKEHAFSERGLRAGL